MTNEIKKSEPNPDDVLTAITSFNDPAIIINIFKDLGWTYSFEIREWLAMARQNANLSVKAKALIQLRKLLREAAETSGLIANVSQTVPNSQGGVTTFHAKRIAGMLNPTKQIKSTIKEIQNDEQKEIRTESNRGSNRRQSHSQGETSGTDSNTSGTDTGRTDCNRSGGLGDVKQSGDRQTPGTVAGAGEGNTGAEIDNPCIKTNSPTCDHDLFPGISSAED